MSRLTRDYMEAEGFTEEQILIELVNQGIMAPSLSFIAYCIGEDSAARLFAEAAVGDNTPPEWQS